MRSVRLLERDSSLASLREYAEDARRGAGRLVLVAGEAGVGKTALLECLEEQLTGRGLGVGRMRRPVDATPVGAAARHRRADRR